MTFTATGTYNTGNTFDIQLSDAAGAFGTPVSIGSIANTLTTVQTVTTTIPAGTASGTGYRIRVVASNPATTSSPASAALTIVSNPTVSIAPNSPQTYTAGASGSPLTATETPATGNTRVWQVSSTSGSGYTPVAGQTGTSYTPTFATPGIYYVVATTTFAACTDVTSNEVVVTVNAAPANTINTPTFAAAPICATAAAALDVTFTASGTYAATNNFLVQLSDAAGSFAAPVTIATITNNLTTAQTVTTTIPAGTASGTGYRIRVVSDDPAVTSAGTSAALTIVSNPTVSIAPGGLQTVAVGGSGTLLTATETPTTGTTRVWQVSSTSGGPFTNISPAQTGTTYTPTFATAGTYFVRVLSTFAACAAVPSNEVQVDVTNPVPTITGISPSLAIAGSPGFTLTVSGTNFLASSTATFNGVSRATTFVSSSQLTVAVLAADIAAAGTFNVAVTNAAPGGGTTAATAASTFTVTPQPTGPACVTQGFESTTFPPAGWLQSSVTRSTSAGDIKTGSAAATFAANAGSLTTAPLAYPNLLSFALGRSTNTSAKTLIVEVSTTTQTGTFTTVASYDHSNVPSGSYDVYSVDLSAYSTTAQVWVRFRKVSSTTSPWRLDDVNVYCAATPEIDVTQGATAIASGGSYAYANTVVNTTTDATFTIANTGTGVLNISNIVLSNNAGGSFSIQTSPLPTTVAAGASTPLVVRFAPTAVGVQTATLTISNDDSNEGTYTIALTGKALDTEPVAPQPTASVSNITATSADITVAGGTGAKRLVVLRATTAAAVAPLDGTTYTASLSYGSALPTGRTGTGNYVVVADGSSSTFTVSGLSSATDYAVEVYAYNDGGTAGAENYLTATPGAASFTTSLPQIGVAQAGVLLLEDDMNYPSGALLKNNGWVVHSSGTGPIAVASGNITAAQYPVGTAGPASNRATSSGQEDINRAFTTPVGSSTIYLSAVVNITGDYDGYFLHLMDNTQTGTGSVFRGKLFTQSVGSGASNGFFRFGLSVSGTSSTLASAYASGSYSINTPYLVVVKYVTNPGGNDEASLFVFDAASAAPIVEPTPTVGPLTEANSIAAGSLNAVALRQDTTTPFYDVDGIRVATGWGSAIGRPAFTGPAASLATGNYYDVIVNNADQVTTTGPARIEHVLTLTSGKVTTSAASPLTLYAAATTSGGSAASFVNGPLARIVAPGPATTVFPVGKDAAFRPLTLNATAQTSTTTYTGEVFNSSARTTGVDAPLNRVSNIRYATITPDVQPSGFSGTLTMAFDVDDYVTDPQATSLVMAKRDGNGSWLSIGRTAATGTATGGNVAGDLTSGVFTSFSDFALASTAAPVGNILDSNPLPVELTAFSAQRQPDKTVTLKWNTASEKNSARFEVQRSLDGREYKLVAAVAAQGASTQATAYAALDKTAPAGRLYYRLRQIDLDGSSAFSPVVTVAGAGETAKVELYPNPAHSRISFIAAAATPYRVLNQLGQSLLRGTTEAGTASIGIEALPTGLYFLELQTATGRTVQKFEKE